MIRFRTLWILVISLLAALPGTAQEPAPNDYRVFTGDGAAASLDDLVQAMATADVTFVGEEHNDPTAHWIELELLRRAHQVYGAGEDGRGVTLSLEMFESDVQDVLDEYLAGLITETHFRAASRPWDAYETDYRPLVELAKAEGLPVIASNAPRRYANRVTRMGRDGLLELGPDARATLAPLPYGEASEAYRNQWIRVIAAAGEAQAEACGSPEEETDGHARPRHDASTYANALHTQALWDATMAFWIADHLLRNPGDLVLHMVGSFHVERGTGIPEHLARYRPGTSQLIIVVRAVEDIEAFDPERDGEREDFVVLTSESSTREVDICR